VAFNKTTKGVVFVRSLAFKLFTLLLAVFLLLSFSTPAFALPARYYLAIMGDLDDNGYPHARGAKFIVIPMGWGGGYLLIVRVEVRAKTTSEENSTIKSSGSPRVDEEFR
jgi:hypothetical protein